MYTERVIVETKSKEFKVEVVKRLPHDFSKAHFIVRMNGVERIKAPDEEAVMAALCGLIESLYEATKRNTIKAY